MASSTVLIVEDNEKNLKLVRDLLQVNGYRTLEAGSGREGIRLAGEHVPDLILMDIQLPDMDGITALNHLRADAHTAQIPVLALTAFAMKRDREHFLSSGFDGYIAKPIDVTAFPSQVQQYCVRGHQETP